MENALEVTQDEKPVLFDTKTPSGVIDRARLIANTLTPLVESAKLYSVISGRKYVKVEGWNTMLSMLGIFSHVEYSRKLDRENETAYEARVLLKTLDGKDVGSGEAICSSKERNWSGRDEFAIRSMAQTRATGKAARNGFSWIMSLAGYEVTPAEEMIHEEPAKKEAPVKSEYDQSNDILNTRFTAPKGFVSKAGKPYSKVMDDEGATYFVFDQSISEYLNTHAEKMVKVMIERRPKGTTIVGLVD